MLTASRGSKKLKSSTRRQPDVTFDRDGTPTERTLRFIREWDYGDGEADRLFEFIKQCWRYPAFVQNVRPGIWALGNCDLTGNEEVVRALKQNYLWPTIRWCTIEICGRLLVVATGHEGGKELNELENFIFGWAFSEKKPKLPKIKP